MNRSSKVKAMKQHQSGVASKQVKPGKTFNGANFVAQKDESTKKVAAKSSAARKKK